MLTLQDLWVLEGLETHHAAQKILQDLSGSPEFFSHDLCLKLKIQVLPLHPQCGRLLKICNGVVIKKTAKFVAHFGLGSYHFLPGGGGVCL